MSQGSAIASGASQVEAGRRSPRWFRSPTVIVAALTLVAFVLRGILAIGDSLAGDEVFSLFNVRDHSLGGTVATVRDVSAANQEASPPLYYVFAWFSAQLGDALWLIRLPAVIASTATVPVLYALGRRAFSPRTGLIAAAVWALLPFGLFYGSEARPYALLCLLAAAATLSFLVAVSYGGARRWTVYALLAAAVLYTHYTGAAVLVFHVLWGLVACPERRRAVLASSGAAFLLFAPWLPFVHTNPLYIYGLLGPNGVGEYARTALQAFPAHPQVPLRALPGVPALVALALALAAACVAVVRRAAIDRGRILKLFCAPPGLLACAAAATPAGLIAVAIVGGETIFLPRTLAASVPALVVVVAALASASPRPTNAVATTILIAVVALGAVRTLDTDNRRPQFAQLAEYVDARARPGESLLVVSLAPPQTAGSQYLSINFDRPHRQFFWGATDKGLWERAARQRQRVFVVYPLFPGLADQVVPPAGTGFVPVARERARGFIQFDLVVYELRRR